MGLGAWLTPQDKRIEHATGAAGLRWTTWSDVADSATAVGWVDRDRAEGLPGVGRGVDLVSAVIGSLSPNSVKWADEHTRPIELLARPQLLQNPDPQWHGASTWTSAAVADLQWDGNCFAPKTAPDRLGYPTRLPLLPPWRVSWEPSTDPGDPGSAYIVAGASRRVEVAAADMFHAAVNVASGSRMGRGILHRYQDLLALMVVVERATFVVMRDGKPVGVLSTDMDMTTSELQGAKRAFIDGVRSDGIAALVKAQFESVSWNAQDLALIPAREHNLRLASDMTGVPPYLLGVPSESRVYSNMETEWSNFVRVTVQRYLNPLQDALTGCLPRGQVARYNTDDLTRPDAATRWANHRIAWDIGATSIAEIRQEERMGPMRLEEGGNR